jgi:acyl carrier protein
MTPRTEFFHQLEEILEMKAGTLSGAEKLHDIEAWDSLMVINFLATVDEKYGVALPPKSVAGCKTVVDLANLLPEHVAAS